MKKIGGEEGKNKTTVRIISLTIVENKEDNYEARREANLAKFIVKKPLVPQSDIIEDNIRKVSLWNRISAKERKEKSEVMRQRRTNAIKRKEKLFMEKIRQNIYYMNRWDIVREKRKDIEHMEKMHKSNALLIMFRSPTSDFLVD